MRWIRQTRCRVFSVQSRQADSRARWGLAFLGRRKYRYADGLPGAVGASSPCRGSLSFLGWPEWPLARRILSAFRQPKGGRLSCLIAVRQKRCSASAGFRVSRISDARQERAGALFPACSHYWLNHNGPAACPPAACKERARPVSILPLSACRI